MSKFTNFDHLFNSMIIMDDNGKFIYFNNQASIFFKLPPRLLNQKTSLLQICTTDDLDLEGWLEKCLKGAELVLSPEIKLKLPHAPEIEYYAILKFIPLKFKDIKAFAIQFLDMTVEKNLYLKYRSQVEELKKTHSQILQADKLASLGELTAAISHEINNPLTIAAGNSEMIQTYLMMKDPTSKFDQIKQANSYVMESLDRVNQIIKNMKDFLRQSEEEKEYCNLEEVLESATEWALPMAKKAGVEIKKDIQIKKTVALANRIRLEQVVVNLLKNSIDAIIESGNNQGLITLSLSKSESDQQTFIDVIDNGPGLSPEMKENLFKPFMTTKEAGDGMGLGLSICSKIIEAHHGKLEYIESDSGCQFRVKLPLIEIYSYTRNNKSFTGPRNQKRVLVLDNEVQILNVVNSFLLNEDFVFIGSSSPIDALDFLQKADIDLIITDFSMPEMTGSEFAQLAREKLYQGPILYMTSAKFIDEFNRDKDALGISGMILKPFTKEVLLKTIRRALEPKVGDS